MLSLVPLDDRWQLAVLLGRRRTRTHRGKWSLPGSFMRERERLDEAVARTLREKCGVTGRTPRQLGVFDDPARDSRGWVISVGHLDVVSLADREATSLGDDATWRPVDPRTGEVDLPDGQESLPFDHDQIVERAVRHLQAAHADRPDPSGLLSPPFTIRTLRVVHEAVMGAPLQKDTFRRAVEPHLHRLDGTVTEGRGRPAHLYRQRD